MNSLNQYRLGNDLSFAEIGRRCELSRSIVLKHCKGESPISGEAALRYHVNLGIPLPALRPDLYQQREAVGHNAL